MKYSSINLVLAGGITVSLMTGCGGVIKEKTNDIPATTQSKEATATFRKGLMSLDQNDNQRQGFSSFRPLNRTRSSRSLISLNRGQTLRRKNLPMIWRKPRQTWRASATGKKLYYDFTSTYLTSDWDKRLKVGQEIATKYRMLRVHRSIWALFISRETRQTRPGPAFKKPLNWILNGSADTLQW